MRPRQRVAAYAVVRPGPDPEQVLLVRASARSDTAGRWFLPGGGVDHGEHPERAVVREVAEETGLQVRVVGLRQVLTDVMDLPHRRTRLHTVRLVFDVEVLGGTLRPEEAGSSDELRLLTPARAADLPLAGYVARALDLPEPSGEPSTARPGAPGEPLPPLSGVGDDGAPGAAPRRLRVAAYGVALDGEGAQQRILLTRLAARIGGSGRWTLPGGGLDHGEEVEAGLRREMYEETGLSVESVRLTGVSSTHFTGHAPDGTLEDFHGVRLVHRVEVGPGEPRVVEVDGSTAEARWVPLGELGGLGVVGLVREALVMLGHPVARSIGG